MNQICHLHISSFRILAAKVFFSDVLLDECVSFYRRYFKETNPILCEIG